MGPPWLITISGGRSSTDPDEVLARRRIEERVRGEAAVGRELDRPRGGQERWFDRDLVALLQHVHRPGKEVEHHDLRRCVGTPSHERDRLPFGGDERVVDRVVREIQVQELTGARVDHGNMLLTVPRPDACDPAVVEERVRRDAEHPLWPAELRIHRADRVHLALDLAIQVPPAGAVRDEVQDTIRTPLRLEDRLRCRLPGDEAFAGHRPGRVEFRDPQLGAVPREVRQIPGEPRELGAVGRDARRREEVAAVHDDRRITGTVRRDGHDLVDDAVVLMAFADADHPHPVRGHAAVRVPDAPVRLRRDGRRRLPGIVTVEPLIGEVRREDDAAMHDVRASAVLVHLGPGVGAWRRHVDRRSPGIGPDDHGPSALRRTALDPVRRTVLQPHVGERHAALDEHRRTDRGAPRAVRRDRPLTHRGLRPTITRVTFSEPPFVVSTSRNPPCR